MNREEAKTKFGCMTSKVKLLTATAAAECSSSCSLHQMGRATRADPDSFSINRRNYFEQPPSYCHRPATAEEMEELMSRIDRNCRLIKGDVFLWKDKQTWEDLWDVKGEITPP
jgi:hypothetical protein